MTSFPLKQILLQESGLENFPLEKIDNFCTKILLKKSNVEKVREVIKIIRRKIPTEVGRRKIMVI